MAVTFYSSIEYETDLEEFNTLEASDEYFYDDEGNLVGESHNDRESE